MNFEVCLSKTKFDSKPGKLDVGLISSSIAAQRTTVSFEQFVKALGNGQTYTPAVFKKDKRVSREWQSQQVFAADIDHDNLSKADIAKLCAAFSVKPSIIHESFSSTPEARKWRVIYITDKPVTDPAQALCFLRAITKHFDGDTAIVDLARMLYSTTKDKIHHSTLNLVDLNKIDLGEFHRTPPSTKNLGTPKKNKTTANANAYLRYIVNQIKYAKGPRYQIIWHNTRKLAQKGWYTEETIQKAVIGGLLSAVHYTIEDYDRSIPELIQNGIAWGSKHVWED